MEQHRQRSQ